MAVKVVTDNSFICVQQWVPFFFRELLFQVWVTVTTFLNSPARPQWLDRAGPGTAGECLSFNVPSEGNKTGQREKQAKDKERVHVAFQTLVLLIPQAKIFLFFSLN